MKLFQIFGTNYGVKSDDTRTLRSILSKREDYLDAIIPLHPIFHVTNKNIFVWRPNGGFGRLSRFNLTLDKGHNLTTTTKFSRNLKRVIVEKLIKDGHETIKGDIKTLTVNRITIKLNDTD